MSSVNVSALPDKGERLKSQVKHLEEALEALSLTSVALNGEILACNVKCTWLQDSLQTNTNFFLSLSCDETWDGSGHFQLDGVSRHRTRELTEYFELRKKSHHIICYDLHNY